MDPILREDLAAYVAANRGITETEAEPLVDGLAAALHPENLAACARAGREWKAAELRRYGIGAVAKQCGLDAAAAVERYDALEDEKQSQLVEAARRGRLAEVRQLLGLDVSATAGRPCESIAPADALAIATALALGAEIQAENPAAKVSPELAAHGIAAVVETPLSEESLTPTE